MVKILTHELFSASLCPQLLEKLFIGWSLLSVLKIARRIAEVSRRHSYPLVSFEQIVKIARGDDLFRDDSIRTGDLLATGIVHRNVINFNTNDTHLPSP